MIHEKPTKTAIGIAWYRPDQWEDLKAYCDDREALDDSYEEWKRGATKALHDLRRNGEHAEPVDFDVNEFRKWCEALEKRPVASSRSEFTLFVLRHPPKP